MATGNSFFASRGPMYFGGLLLGLAAGVGFYKAKQAMMPKFHEIQETRDEATMAPGGSVRFVYSEDPQYFLIPGLPTAAAVYRRAADGSSAPLMRMGYGELVDKEPGLGPITEEGSYSLSANFYICAEPGAAHCAKLVLNQEIKVDRNSTMGDDRVAIDLAQLAHEALKLGDIKVEDEAAPPKAPDKPAE